MRKVPAFGQREPRGLLEPIDIGAALSHPLGEHEVELAVLSCSVCHSDVHLVDGDWGEVTRPLVPGHEIVGRVVDAGVTAKESFPSGAIVGLGWQAGSCGRCDACAKGREHLCAIGKVRTCVGRPGGFAERVRADARFCFALPPSIDLESAAPLFCAGLTVFSPLERFNVSPASRVGVVGLGGLGHLAVRFAHALGATVISFDPDPNKRALASELGAAELVVLDERSSLPAAAVDLLLVTTHASLRWSSFLSVLRLEGTMCLIGVPSEAITVPPDPLLDEQKSITGSVIGSPRTMRRMLTFAAEREVRPIVESAEMTRAGVNEALDRVRSGRARMRVVLHSNF